MKYALAAVAVVACIAGGALAQTTPPAPAAPVPPSACPAYPAAPALPAAETLKKGRGVDQKAVNAGTEKVNAWIATYQQVGTCRREEVVRLETQIKTRVDEFKAGNDAAMRVRDEWQGTINSLTPPAKK
jgi:type IV secretory pathway VirJ component